MSLKGEIQRLRSKVKEKKGIALMMTLWIVVLLAVVAASFAVSMRTGTASVRNFKEDISAYYYAVAAYEDAIKFLLNDTDNAVDYADQDGKMIVETEGETFKENRELPFGRVEVRIIDESSKININSLSQIKWIGLLERSGVEFEEAREIADSILDWIDVDDLRYEYGAETDYYEELGYRAKNAPFSTVEELLLVKGIDEDILYGSAELELTGIYDHLSVCVGRGININTVSENTMEILGIPSFDMDSILAQRAEGPVIAIPASLRKLGIKATTISNCFKIRSSVTPTGTSYTRTIETVIKRVSKGSGYEVKVMYWRDDV